ncbi:MAG: sigma-70 family RNA polymerase sigma factor [Bacteroidaceae bacterium]|nr:sigma-70 family RNA polymerase sigma factor [Bacteroidaceae bacterium]
MEITEQEFAKMMNTHKSTIYTVCYMFSNDEDEVADLFQEVMIRVWRGLPSFNGSSDMKTWIYRIALNTSISMGRKKKRRHETKLAMDINLFADKDKETEQVNILHKRISRLLPLDRAIVLLWLENISYEEIGAIIGISAKNVSVRLVRIREQLKSMSND